LNPSLNGVKPATNCLKRQVTTVSSVPTPGLGSSINPSGCWNAVGAWHAQVTWPDSHVVPAQDAPESAAKLSGWTRVYEGIDAAVEVTQPEGEVEQASDVTGRTRCVCNMFTALNVSQMTTNGNE